MARQAISGATVSQISLLKGEKKIVLEPADKPSGRGSALIILNQNTSGAAVIIAWMSNGKGGATALHAPDGWAYAPSVADGRLTITCPAQPWAYATALLNNMRVSATM